MKQVAKFGRDAAGLTRICGPVIALQWMARVLIRTGDVARRHDLQSADAAMGEGPFSVTLRPYRSSFRITGPCAFGGIREIYVRDVYRRGWWPDARPDDVIVDLGANMGNFSALVLGTDPAVRVVAVEPSLSLNAQFVRSLGLNPGFLERVQLIRGFVGSRGRLQEEAARADHNYFDVDWISEDELIRRGHIRRIAVLKCDIEGSEFGLLGPRSRLLAMTRVLACEVHAFAGDVRAFVSGIQASGFTLGPVQYARDGSLTLLAARTTRPE